MIKNKLFMLLIPLLVCGTGLFAQNTAVQGIVTGSPDGNPIPGASVVVKGSVRGTTTDASGAFNIAAEAGDVLVVSFLGYKSQEVPVGGRTAIDVSLEEDAELVEEVIVIGYGTMKKSDLTGSVASVKASDVTQVSAGSIDKLLQGRVAGLTVIDNSNDSPEGNVTMRVRGISSINGSNSPLVVVDGVPMGDAGNLTSVNPNIIESIEVLKDASATAIYGSRGAN
ncbi:TonB-dependent receptor plug domain-containing protein, partial [Alistipes finegoldii]